VRETLADIQFDGVVECAQFLNHLALAHQLLNSYRREFIPGPFLSELSQVSASQALQREASQDYVLGRVSRKFMDPQTGMQA
jgi:hypothetical protein